MFFSLKNGGEEDQHVAPRIRAFPGRNRRIGGGVDALAGRRPLVGCPLSEAILGAAIFPTQREGRGRRSHVRSKYLVGEGSYSPSKNGY